MNYSSTEESKGQYCRFIVNGDGKYELEPVKIPQYIIDEREERRRQRQFRARVERNREKALKFNLYSVIYMAAALAVCVAFCCAYIALQTSVTSRLKTITQLENQLQQAVEKNDLMASRVSAGRDLQSVQQIARDELGMVSIDPNQVVYYDLQEQDYMLQYKRVE